MAIMATTIQTARILPLLDLLSGGGILTDRLLARPAQQSGQIEAFD
jgi:phospholipid N-methyltransferase